MGIPRTGCGNGRAGTPSESTQPSESVQPSESQPAGEGKPLEGQTIKVAVLSSGYIDAYPDMWKEVCDAFAAETGATSGGSGADAAMGGVAATKSVAGLGSIMEVFFDPVNDLVS